MVVVRNTQCPECGQDFYTDEKNVGEHWGKVQKCIRAGLSRELHIRNKAMSDDFKKWMPREFPANNKEVVNKKREESWRKTRGILKSFVGEDAALAGSEKSVVQVRPGTKLIRTFDPGEDIVGMVEHKGRIIVATKRAMYEYNPELETWDQMVFRNVDPDDFKMACDAYGKAAGDEYC